MKIIDRLLSRNYQLMQERLDGPYFVEYKVKAEEIVKIIMWLVLASLIVLVIRGLEYESARVFGKTVGLAALIAIELISLLLAYRKLLPFIREMNDIKSNWNTAIYTISMVGLLAVGLSAYDLINLFRSGSVLNESCQVYTCPALNMTVTVPPGYTEISHDTDSQDDICWYVWNNDNTIWVVIYPGWTSTDSYVDDNGNKRNIIDAHYDKFVRDDKVFYQGGMYSEPRMMEIDDNSIYFSTGKHIKDSDKSHITYRLMRRKALIVVTYVYDDKLDRSDQERKAYEFVSDIKFY